MRKFGWIPDIPDARDFKYSISRPQEMATPLPPKIDLRELCPPVYDQGSIGSCTAQGIAALLQFNRMKQGLKNFPQSRLWIYYVERMLEGTKKYDNGAQIRTGIKVVASNGAPPENVWPYIESKFAVKPPWQTWIRARRFKASDYLRLTHTNITELKKCLASGFPFVFGLSLYGSFMADKVTKSGIVPMPTGKEKLQGGHAMVCVGYDDSIESFIVRNSWGPIWGIDGYCMIPYDYMTNGDLGDDYWTIRKVS